MTTLVRSRAFTGITLVASGASGQMAHIPIYGPSSPSRSSEIDIIGDANVETNVLDLCSNTPYETKENVQDEEKDDGDDCSVSEAGHSELGSLTSSAFSLLDYPLPEDAQSYDMADGVSIKSSSDSWVDLSMVPTEIGKDDKADGMSELKSYQINNKECPALDAVA